MVMTNKTFIRKIKFNLRKEINICDSIRCYKCPLHNKCPGSGVGYNSIEKTVLEFLKIQNNLERW